MIPRTHTPRQVFTNVQSVSRCLCPFWNTEKKKYVAEYDDDYNGEDLDIGGVDIDRG